MRRPLLLGAALVLWGCHDPMKDRGKMRPLEPSAFFPDGSSARHPVQGTVPREGGAGAREAPRARPGAEGGQPAPVSREILERGEERYGVFCSVCHGRAGYGDGMVVRRGFTPPPSFHIARLREAPLEHFVEVMARGLGAMYSYADRVPPEDMWAIAAHLRVLQLSQHAAIGLLNEEERHRVEGAPR